MNHYSHIIIDEIHERDIDTDLLLIIVRRLFAKNAPKTKIILMSATMDVHHFLNFFRIPVVNGNDFYPPVIDLLQSPRNFKISEFFLEDFESIGNMDDHINYDEPGISDKIYELGVTFISVCLQQIKQAVDYKKMRNGTILIFLPGLNEIENFHNKMEILEKRIRSKRDDWPTVCILHSSMSSDEQYNA